MASLRLLLHCPLINLQPQRFPQHRVHIFMNTDLTGRCFTYLILSHPPRCRRPFHFNCLADNGTTDLSKYALVGEVLERVVRAAHRHPPLTSMESLHLSRKDLNGPTENDLAPVTSRKSYLCLAQFFQTGRRKRAAFRTLIPWQMFAEDNRSH